MTLQEVMNKALAENRLAYKVVDHNYQACGGGKFDYAPYLPTDTEPGPWLPEILEPELCVRGYHVTLDPLIWPGNVVFLVETRSPVLNHDKKSVSTLRLLRRVYPNQCVGIRIWVRVKYPLLDGADLRGTTLRGAWLKTGRLIGADLQAANLARAELEAAHLGEADLKGANLVVACLRSASCVLADFRGADLKGADLTGANLEGADFRGADLRGAILDGARLGGGCHFEADFEGASRGPHDDPIPGWRVEYGTLVKED